MDESYYIRKLRAIILEYFDDREAFDCLYKDLLEDIIKDKLRYDKFFEEMRL